MQAEWDLFMAYLNSCYHKACHDLATMGNSTVAQQKMQSRRCQLCFERHDCYYAINCPTTCWDCHWKSRAQKTHRRPPRLRKLQKQVCESFAENIDSFSPNENVLIQTLFPNHPFIQIHASNFVVKISLPKTKLNKFLKSAKSMLSLLGKLVSVALIPLA